MTKESCYFGFNFNNNEEALSWVGNFRRKRRKYQVITYTTPWVERRELKAWTWDQIVSFHSSKRFPKHNLARTLGPPRWPHICYLFEMFLFLCLSVTFFVQTFIFLPKWFWKCLSQSREHFSSFSFPLSCHFSTKFIVPLLRCHPSPSFNRSFDLPTSECAQVWKC